IAYAVECGMPLAKKRLGFGGWRLGTALRAGAPATASAFCELPLQRTMEAIQKLAHRVAHLDDAITVDLVEKVQSRGEFNTGCKFRMRANCDAHVIHVRLRASPPVALRDVRWN